MKLQDSNSLFSELFDIKLSDTEDTFSSYKLITPYEYIPLVKDKESFFFGWDQLAFNTGDARLGTEIKKEKESLFYTFGANRPSSNAQSISIGYKSHQKYYFVREEYGDIYQDSFYVSARAILILDSLWDPTLYDQSVVFSCYGKTKVKAKTEAIFERWLEKASQFQEALSEENLKQLRKKRS